MQVNISRSFCAESELSTSLSAFKKLENYVACNEALLYNLYLSQKKNANECQEFFSGIINTTLEICHNGLALNNLYAICKTRSDSQQSSETANILVLLVAALILTAIAAAFAKFVVLPKCAPNRASRTTDDVELALIGSGNVERESEEVDSEEVGTSETTLGDSSVAEPASDTAEEPSGEKERASQASEEVAALEKEASSREEEASTSEEGASSREEEVSSSKEGTWSSTEGTWSSEKGEIKTKEEGEINESGNATQAFSRLMTDYWIQEHLGDVSGQFVFNTFFDAFN